ncbi:MAG: hypothetical protein U0798_00345 [Gemmataceae bacterium]
MLPVPPRQDLSQQTSSAFSYSLLVMILALLVGAGLRLLWVEDIEYKFDEKDYFASSLQNAETKNWPLLGPPSSTGDRAPGGTYWIFIALVRISGADSAPELARACQVLNLIALVGFMAFVWRCVPQAEKERWWAALVLVCVNPLVVLFQRKIWNPAVTPIFLLIALAGWWYRRHRTGAFVWGFVGVFIGQIHIAGLFLVAGFALWAFLFDRKNVRWGWWIAGAGLAALTLVPWIQYMASNPDSHASMARKWGNIFTFQFWNRWFTEPVGISLHYSLGQDFTDFLSGPTLRGSPTYLVGILHGLMILLGATIFARAIVVGWSRRANWRDTVIGRDSQTSFAICSCMLGFGLVLTATQLPVHRHYMLLAFPFPFLWLASISLVDDTPNWLTRSTGRKLLLALAAVQATISFCFLHYIHTNPRIIRGDYGTPYRAQIEKGLPEKASEP